MSCLKEQNHRNQLESGCESSAVCPSESCSLHTRAWDTIIHGPHPGDPSHVIGPGVGGSDDRGWPGQDGEAGCGTVVEPQCANYRFCCPLPPHHDPEASLPQCELPTHPEYHVLGAQSSPCPFLSPMPSLGSRSQPSSWATEGGEIYDAVVSICPESMDDHGCELFPKQDTIPQNQVDISQLANGPLMVFLEPLEQLGDYHNTVVVVNCCSPGQMIHSLPATPDHQASSPEPHYAPPSTSRGPPEHCLSLGKDAGVLVSSSQTGAPPSSQPYLGLPPLQPSPSGTHTLLASGQISSGYSYSHRPGPYFPQYHPAPCPRYPDSRGLVPVSQPQAPDSRGAESLWDSTSKRPCNCTKSQCLKLYCGCFANGDVCNNCNCVNCFNNGEHESERYQAIKTVLDRNPKAFWPKIGNGKSGEVQGRHNKGCNCKRSGCLKNYCECYEAKIMCSSTCQCVGCSNYEDERRTMLWDSPDSIFYKRANCQKNKCPLSCITLDVVEATCGCLLVQAEKAEKKEYTLPQAERVILEEFGQCLTQIVHSIFKSSGQ